MTTSSLIYTNFEPKQEGLREALCALGNGYFVTRGAAAEVSADATHYPGTYLAGGYNRLTTEIAGRVVENEDLVNLPNWLPLSFHTLDSDGFDPSSAKILAFQQELDMQRGILLRTIRYQDTTGRRLRLREKRIVHMHHPHLAALQTTLVAENWSGPLEIVSALDGEVSNTGVQRYRNLNNNHLEPLQAEAGPGDGLFLKVRTCQSHLRIALYARTRLFDPAGQELSADHEYLRRAAYTGQRSVIELQQAKPIIIEKTVALYTSRDRAIAECGIAARGALVGVRRFNELLSSHCLRWEQLWRRFNSEIEYTDPNSEDRVRTVLQLHLFHLLQTVSPHSEDLDVGVPARGWHGEAYRGHIFWDELFIFPLLNLRIPEITRALLKYRCRRLDQARALARVAGYRGAMFPWQSGSDGREETQTVHLNPRSGSWLADHSHLQRHVNAAIAYNVWQYYQASADMEFLAYHGAELIFEIARFWSSQVVYNKGIDRYEILGVMGPDEYHDAYPDSDQPGLNNNAYTNVMAVWVLNCALGLLEVLSEHRRQELCELLQLGPKELEFWREISAKIRLFFHAGDIISQFQGYEQLAEFNWDAYRRRYRDIQRLDRILQAEGDSTNRYKVSKQADVLMLFYLLSAEEIAQLFRQLGYRFDPEMIPRNIDYYTRRTAHGSTLSRIVHSWVLARGDRARSWQFFKEALFSDMADLQGGTTAEGIHLGAMAGTVDLIQRGYTGLEMREETLWLNPCLPSPLAKLFMRIRYRGHLLVLTMTQDRLQVSSRKAVDGSIKIGLPHGVYEVAVGETCEFELARR